MESPPVDEHAHLRAGIAASALAYTLWGSSSVYWRALRDLDPAELIAYRVMLSLATLVLVMVFSGHGRAIAVVARDRHVRLRAAAAAVTLATNWLSYMWAVTHDHLLEAALGYFMAPLCSTALGVVILGENLSRRQRAAVTAALAAVVVLTLSYGRVPIAALLIAFSWATYGYVKKQTALAPMDGLTAETALLLPAAVVFAAVTASHPDSIPSAASLGEIVLLAASGVVTIVPLALFAVGARRLPLSVIAPLQYIVPVINFGLGWLAFGEDLPAAAAAGFALIWIALVVSTVDLVQRQRVSWPRAEQPTAAEAPGGRLAPGR